MMSIIPIIAEVLDKEPSIITIGALLGSIALIGLLCSYWRWWLAPSFLIAALILGVALFEEFSSVGLLRSSESPSYVTQFYLAVALVIVLPVLGAVLSVRRTRRTSGMLGAK